MEVVEDAVSRQAQRELPLAVALGLGGVEPSASITQRKAVRVVQADRDTKVEESAAGVPAGFEAVGGFGGDALLLKEAEMGLQSKAMRERPKEFEGGGEARASGRLRT